MSWVLARLQQHNTAPSQHSDTILKIGRLISCDVRALILDRIVLESRRLRKMGWEDTMEAAKRGHRPRLKNWSRDGFNSRRAAEFESLASKVCREEETSRCRIARESASGLTPEAFVAKYEMTSTPVLITGIPKRLMKISYFLLIFYKKNPIQKNQVFPKKKVGPPVVAGHIHASRKTSETVNSSVERTMTDIKFALACGTL